MSDTNNFNNKFCWWELGTTDPDGSKKFYTELFGWTTTDVPIGEDAVYTMLAKDGKTVGALNKLPDSSVANGIPSHWMPYINVENVDATTAKAAENQGKVLMEPFDVMDAGRMSIIQDPTGATVSVWQAGNHKGADLYNATGGVCWNELATPNKAAAGEFYTNTFGWDAKYDENMNYTIFNTDGTYAGGMMETTPEMGPIPPNWMTYIAVDNVDDTTAKAKSMGAKTFVEPMDIPNVGRFAVLQDPQGAAISLLQAQAPSTN